MMIETITGDSCRMSEKAYDLCRDMAMIIIDIVGKSLSQEFSRFYTKVRCLYFVYVGFR